MNNIKSTFSIKDLENLSGIKAHTIRIWEKRYELLEPMRTDTNIRLYDIKNLQKLLNVVLLTNFGYKISKISKLNQADIEKFVLKIQTEKTVNDHVISSLKMAMLNFDQSLFVKTYNDLLSEKEFSAVFFDTFIPLLEEIGVLWTTNTITPAHEHFISHLIKQKILIEIEKYQIQQKAISDETYILYLPFNEIHDLGLLFLHHEIITRGHQSIYLGRSLPIENLIELNNHFNKITYITYLTVEPSEDEIDNYINEFDTTILKGNDNELLILGRKAQAINNENLPNRIKSIANIKDFLVTL
ncbi:MerR family transcriptional regulator [Flavobacterium difficile]|uniref:MerR family transcriptional regulator n=1 Tax=Flavobacterium difficile TaxID=2709659 RepID=A0ABX0I6F6_9FLAO|nr:MerR family transcriptional regulator [Flavobacterium difficile]NHM01317.1 MerR family transcriptional regulator [Flavobacterium difficile]